MSTNQYDILFKKGKPIPPPKISGLIDDFGKSYNATVRNIIQNTEVLNEEIFKLNAAKLLINFKMTRKGPFHGIKITRN